MASMKRIRTELLALGFAAATTALLAERTPVENRLDSQRLDETQARAQSALYLEGAATHARLDRTRGRWAVTDGRDTAWLDARSGELLEIELHAPR
jgi:hypothetical protein